MKSAPWQDQEFLAKRYLYLAAIDGRLCKIGVSKRPRRRVTRLSQTQPHKAKLIKVWPKSGHLEPTVHQILKPLRERGEWFKCEPDFAEWICEMVISQEQPTANRAVFLYKQLKDGEARWEKLAISQELKDERAALSSGLKSLEDELHAIGFDMPGYQIRISTQREVELQEARRRDPWGEHINATPTGDVRRVRPPRKKQMQERQTAALTLEQEQEQERRLKAIAALASHQVAALRAVAASNGFDKIDAFT